MISRINEGVEKTRLNNLMTRNGKTFYKKKKKKHTFAATEHRTDKSEGWTYARRRKIIQQKAAHFHAR